MSSLLWLTLTQTKYNKTKRNEIHLVPLFPGSYLVFNIKRFLVSGRVFTELCISQKNLGDLCDKTWEMHVMAELGKNGSWRGMWWRKISKGEFTQKGGWCTYGEGWSCRLFYQLKNLLSTFLTFLSIFWWLKIISQSFHWTANISRILK